ncbi:hypothetical protein J7L60_04195 [Candidatus Bathyarchaeota archaeon]|nr:hypothetical protein [Candidatus Bathyarchaeota archaeon]
MEEVKVRIEAIVHPTEDEGKVSRAIKNILGDIDLEKAPLEGGLLLKAEVRGLDSLSHLKKRLERQRIRDAARALLLRSIEGNRITFGLNRQAAYAGRLSFSTSGESPLGPITVAIECGDPEALVKWLTRKEERGEGRSRTKRR